MGGTRGTPGVPLVKLRVLSGLAWATRRTVCRSTYRGEAVAAGRAAESNWPHFAPWEGPGRALRRAMTCGHCVLRVRCLVIVRGRSTRRAIADLLLAPEFANVTSSDPNRSRREPACAGRRRELSEPLFPSSGSPKARSAACHGACASCQVFRFCWLARLNRAGTLETAASRKIAGLRHRPAAPSRAA